MKGILLAAIVMGTALSANAESKRYLVKIKSQTAFNSIVMQMRHQSPAFFQNPRVSQFQIFNQNTKSTEALENVGMLVVESEEGVSALKNNPSVEYVEQEVWHPLPTPVQIDIARSTKPNPAPAPGNTVVTPWGITAVKAPLVWKTTQGENATVLVLDTGLDVQHPAVKNRFVKGQNFVMDEQPVDDITDGVGHGTHVSGTIAGSADDGSLIGVAPKTRLMMGRVCATEGCSSIAIVQGVNWGIDQQVQVISMSLSGPGATQSEQESFQRAEQANIVVVAASGNDSAARVGFPAALPNSFAVGAVDSALNRASFSNYGPELALVAPGVNVYSSVPRGTGRDSLVTLNQNKMDSLQFKGSPIGRLADTEVVYASFGAVGDLQAADVRGKIALFQRGGGVSFKDKATNAIAAGAIGVLVYNNKPGLDPGFVTTDGTEISIPMVEIPQAGGQALQAAIATGVQKISMEVRATDYASYQGTSMATPHVAGVVALVRSANPGLSAAQVRALLKDTATPLLPNDLNQFGAGMIDADLAVKRALQTAPAPLKLANGF